MEDRMKPWAVSISPRVREGIKFVWHRCFRCRKLIRWEPEFCYGCEKFQRSKRETAEANFDARDIAKQERVRYDIALHKQQWRREIGLV